MGRFLMITYAAMICMLSACASQPKTPVALQEALDKKIAITVPMRITDKGLIVLENIEVDGRSLDMVLDTGATHSAVFENASKRLDLNIDTSGKTLVHGMLKSKPRRIVNFSKVKIGSIELLSKPMVILDERESDFQDMETHDGLIGMDVLADYQIYVSPHTNELRLIPNAAKVYVSTYWRRIKLKENPFQSDNRQLHFIDLRVNGKITPAMIDTGAEFSAMNWAAATFAQAKPIRKKLKEDWKLQGAVGTFRPIAKVKFDRIRSGQKFWRYKEFLIIDFESLDILGIEEEPFIIAGMNLLRDQAIFIDFENDFIAMKPVKDKFEPVFQVAP